MCAVPSAPGVAVGSWGGQRPGDYVTGTETTRGATAEGGDRRRSVLKLPTLRLAWLLGWPASESGRLCHGDGGHEGGDRPERAKVAYAPSGV
jgi:hypothetical protein